MTDTTQSDPPLRIAPPPPGWTPSALPASGPTRMATASLVLGIVSLLVNLLLVPTILAIVFGAIALAHGTAGRVRSIVGIVLGVLGIVGLFVQLAILGGFLIGFQHAAIASNIKASITAGLTDKGVSVTGVVCPPLGQLVDGATELCTASTSTGVDYRVQVQFLGDRGGYTYKVVGTD